MVRDVQLTGYLLNRVGNVSGLGNIVHLQKEVWFFFVFVFLWRAMFKVNTQLYSFSFLSVVSIAL